MTTIFNYFGTPSNFTVWSSGAYVLAGGLGGALISFIGSWLIGRQKRTYEKQDASIERLEKLYYLTDKLNDFLNTILLLSADGVTCFKSMQEGMQVIVKIPPYQDKIKDAAVEIKTIINLFFKSKLSNPFGSDGKLLNQVYYAIETICNVEKISSDTNSEKVEKFLHEREDYFLNLIHALIELKNEIESVTNKVI